MEAPVTRPADPYPTSYPKSRFIGSWALLELDDGDIRQVEAGRVSDLYEVSRANAPLGPLGYPDWYIYRAIPEFWPQNLTSSPDLETVAFAARELFDGLGGAPIDGFVYIDDYALGDMLKITGPLTFPGLAGRISADSADQFFFDEQYRVDDRDGVKAELSEAFAAVFAGVLDIRLPGPEKLGQVLGPAARQGRLQVMTFDTDENAFLQLVKLQRTFQRPTSTADSFALVHANGSASKLDLYLHRTIQYDATVDDDGALDLLIDVELISDIPRDAPAYAIGRDFPGRNLSHLSLYSPHDLLTVRVDGELVDFEMAEEFGYRRYELAITVPANETRRIEYELEGQISMATGYQVSVWHQPLVNNDMVEVRYAGPNDTIGAETFVLVEDVTVDFGG